MFCVFSFHYHSLYYILQILCDIFYHSWIIKENVFNFQIFEYFLEIAVSSMVDTSHMWLLGILNIAIPGKLNFYFMIICFKHWSTVKFFTIQHSSVVWAEIHFTLTVVSHMIVVLQCKPWAHLPFLVSEHNKHIITDLVDVWRLFPFQQSS